MKKLLKNDKFIFSLLIVLGSIFIILPCFQINMWFDESYTVALAKRSIKEIWVIGSKDVHPILYYYIVKLAFLISNNNIIVARLFSCLPLVILSTLGYTHIRKDFGRKVGFLFSFLALFSPACIHYAGELRMYSYAMLFVTIMCIYCYRIIKYEYSIKNWIILSIFSLACAYTHYYGLIIAFIINAGILVYFIIKQVKTKNYKKELISFTIGAICQVVLYMPWLGALLGQTKVVSEGYWIKMPTPIEIITFLNTGLLKETDYVSRDVQVFFATAVFMLFVYMLIRQWKDKGTLPVKAMLVIMSILIALLLIVSAAIWAVLLYPRYLLNLFGLIIFSFAYLLANESDKIVKIFIVCEVIFALGINASLILTNYDESDMKPYEYVAKNMRDGDVFLTDNEQSGFTIIAKNENDEVYKNVYFYNLKNWHVEEPYKAFGKTITNLDDFRNFKGRIWIFSANDFEFQNKVKDELTNVNTLMEEKYDIKYQDYSYTISLIEKY